MKKFKEWLANNFIGIISLVSSVSGSIGAICVSMSQSLSPLEWALIAILLAESIFFISFGLWRKYSYKSYHYPFRTTKSNYVVLDTKVSYKINDKEQLDFSMTREIKSIEPIHNIPGKFIWTGGKINLPKNQTGYSFDPDKNKGIWTYYNIHLNDWLTRGQTKTIKTEFDLIDNATKSEPYVSVTTEEPMKKISFSVELGDKVAGTEAYFEEYRSNEADAPISSKKLPITKDGVITYCIEHPKRFRYYRISWDWK